MTIQILSRRSSLLNDRPVPTRIGAGELCVNTNAGDPGLYFADATAAPSTGLIKVGPTHVGTTQPNNAPVGFTSFSKGESWLDTASTHILKIHDGTTWQLPKAIASITASAGTYPSNPVNGQLHYTESNTTLYIYRTSTSSWVAIA